MANTVLASASRILWRTIESYNIDPNAVFREAGLDPEKISDTESRFPVENMRKAWTLAAEHIADPCFGAKAGNYWFPGDLYAIGYTFLSSTTLTDALGRVARYNEVVDRVISFEMSETQSEVKLSYNNSLKALLDIPALEVARWSVLVALCRRAKSEHFSPLSVRLKQEKPECIEAYQDYFQCDIHFGQKESSVIFDKKAAEEHLPAKNEGLVLVNEKALIDCINNLHQDEITRKVANIITDQLASGNLSDQFVAEKLFMSTRTLQRKLAVEGTTYKQILESIQKEFTSEYLKDKKLSLTEISFLLGFSEQSVFTRACKRWFDKTPSQIRKSI